MTQEEKAKAYDKVVNKLRHFIAQGVDPLITRADVQDFFPELAESEDERIRKEIIVHIKWCEDNGYCAKEEMTRWIDFLKKQGEQKSVDMSIKEKAHQIAWETSKHYDPLLSKESWCEMAALDMASWLKKQGEQKPADKVEPKFKVGDTIIKKHNSDINKFGQFTITDITGGKYWYNDRIICNISEQFEWELVEQKPISFDTSTPVSYDDIPFGEKDYELHEATYFIPEGFHAEIEGDKVIIKRGEQKPAWSEEDERICRVIICDIANDKSICKFEISKSICDEQINWLKSLKERIGG
jgi:hypothetical protein